jgi:hypothetical protein
MRRFTVLLGSMLVVAAVLTAVAFGASIGVQPDPSARDLPRIVAAGPSASTSESTTPSAQATPPSSETGNGSKASTSSPTSSKHRAKPPVTSSATSDGEHEVVEPQLHESDGND